MIGTIEMMGMIVTVRKSIARLSRTDDGGEKEEKDEGEEKRRDGWGVMISRC